MTKVVETCVDGRVLEGVSDIQQQFSEARPFRHVALDNFLEAGLAQRLAASFPGFSDRLAINENGEVGRKAVNEKVTTLGDDWVLLDKLVRGKDFRTLISRITGIPELHYDPEYIGGGTHENLHGQSLDAHVDFNFHPRTNQHRRLNLILYLSTEWHDEWGGSIQLHTDPYLPPDKDETVTITPVFNRCVIFETNEYSWHGFPRINLPENKRHLSRKSFALYYYTDTRPVAELGPEHSTIYVEEHLPSAIVPGVELTADQFQHINNLLSSRDSHIKRLYEDIKEVNSELNGLKESLGHKAPPGIAEEFGGRVGDLDLDNNEHLRALLSRRDTAIARLSIRISELENSTSWKITRPVRRLKKLLGSS